MPRMGRKFNGWWNISTSNTRKTPMKDTEGNRTCDHCGERLPDDDFYRSMVLDICPKCAKGSSNAKNGVRVSFQGNVICCDRFAKRHDNVWFAMSVLMLILGHDPWMEQAPEGGSQFTRYGGTMEYYSAH
jgi:hypothetical protein